MDSYKSVLHGYARIIKFRCEEGGPMDDFKRNSIHSLYEGRIVDGKPNGLGRLITYHDKAVRIGYWVEGMPYGKMIHYNKNIVE